MWPESKEIRGDRKLLVQSTRDRLQRGKPQQGVTAGMVPAAYWRLGKGTLDRDSIGTKPGHCTLEVRR